MEGPGLPVEVDVDVDSCSIPARSHLKWRLVTREPVITWERSEKYLWTDGPSRSSSMGAADQLNGISRGHLGGVPLTLSALHLQKATEWRWWILHFKKYIPEIFITLNALKIPSISSYLIVIKSTICFILSQFLEVKTEIIERLKKRLYLS